MLLLQNTQIFGLATGKILPNSASKFSRPSSYKEQSHFAFKSLKIEKKKTLHDDKKNHSKLRCLGERIYTILENENCSISINYQHSTKVIRLKGLNTNVNIIFHTYNFKVA